VVTLFAIIVGVFGASLAPFIILLLGFANLFVLIMFSQLLGKKI
jgi:hypothetical protein